MANLNLKIVTPEKEIFNDSCDQINVSTSSGEIGILPGHISLMSKILPGKLEIKKSHKTEILAIGEGFLTVTEDAVKIMTDMAIEEGDINEKAIEDAKKRAETALTQKLSDEEYAETLAVLEKSLAQLRVKRRHRKV